MNIAPTLPTACGSLPPEGATAPAARLSRLRGPGWRGTPCTCRIPFVPSLSKDAPSGATAPAARLSRFRGPGWYGNATATLVALHAALDWTEL